jgi:hypothetical protein
MRQRITLANLLFVGVRKAASFLIPGEFALSFVSGA